ncbi:MAG: ROK family protein, partial [Bryobacteraceae bacterium]
GACAIALDCTARGVRYGALERLQRIKRDIGVTVCADIATLGEAEAAASAGADFVLSTMRGYTEETAHIRHFDAEFIRELCGRLRVPVIAEGRIWTGEELRAALDAGAFAAIVGSAITRPTDITRHFVSAIAGFTPSDERWLAGVDIGGTKIKSALVRGDGELFDTRTDATPQSGRVEILERVVDAVEHALAGARRRGVSATAVGIAAAGWIDAATGRVVYGTDTFPGWTGAPIGETVARATGLPVYVENDANAWVLAERHFGAGRGVRNFVCITLGTGVGGGCFIDGALRRGGHAMANAIGHLQVDPEGLPCTCGRRGCLEPYANSAALVRYAGEGRYASAQEVIEAAGRGEQSAVDAIKTLAGYLARGCEAVINLLDPELILIGGGLAQNNPLLLSALESNLAATVPLWRERNIRVAPSPLGYHAGVIGGAAAAMARL